MLDHKLHLLEREKNTFRGTSYKQRRQVLFDCKENRKTSGSTDFTEFFDRSTVEDSGCTFEPHGSYICRQITADTFVSRHTQRPASSPQFRKKHQTATNDKSILMRGQSFSVPKCRTTNFPDAPRSVSTTAFHEGEIPGRTRTNGNLCNPPVRRPLPDQQCHKRKSTNSTCIMNYKSAGSHPNRHFSGDPTLSIRKSSVSDTHCSEKNEYFRDNIQRQHSNTGNDIAGILNTKKIIKINPNSRPATPGNLMPYTKTNNMSSVGKFVVHNGWKIRNYVRPQDRYKLCPNYALKTEVLSYGSQSGTRGLVTHGLMMSRTARNIALTNLVRQNTMCCRNHSERQPDIGLTKRVRFFLETVSRSCAETSSTGYGFQK